MLLNVLHIIKSVVNNSIDYSVQFAQSCTFFAHNLVWLLTNLTLYCMYIGMVVKLVACFWSVYCGSCDMLKLA